MTSRLLSMNDLRDAAEKVQAARNALTAAEQQRDELVRAALGQGARVVDVAEAVGLDRQRIYQIRDSRR